MPSRRDFLRAGSSALAALALPGLAGSELRVGTRLGPGDEEFEHGLTFGARESDRTGRMFGWRVERVPMSDTMMPDAHAVIATIPTNAGNAPLLALTCDAVKGEAFVLASCPPPAGGTARIAAWHGSLVRYGAAQLNDRYRAAMQRDMTGEAWLGWFAMKVLSDSAMRSRDTSAQAIAGYLARPETRFDGHKGQPLVFDSNRVLVHPLYEIASDATGERVVRELSVTAP